MSDLNSKALKDADLEGVSGGAKTAGGFDVAKDGTVTFVDKTGQQLKVSAADWSWLRSQYNDPNPEEFIKTVPAKDLGEIIRNHDMNIGKA